MANVLNCCAFFFYYYYLFIYLFKFGSSGKYYLKAFNFSVLVDSSNKENSEKVLKEAITR